jgi:uncharacterized protein (TIGR03032 family)
MTTDDTSANVDLEVGDASPIADPPLRSVHTSNFPEILAQAPASLLVTTYQAGKLVVLRNDAGVLNTHFRNFAKPMGLAVSGARLAIGTSVAIEEYHNVPAVCPRLDAKATSEISPAPSPSEGATSTSDPSRSSAGGSPCAAPDGEGGEADTRFITPSSQGEGNGKMLLKHDACYLPRRSHTTGDVQIHEMAWVGDELWFVNTAFSCLATRSDVNSFEPCWRPKFIDKLLPGDSCHLNGLAMRDGRIRYVTALGESNEPGGWRANKRNGGVLIDVDSRETIAHGLSMPHSPRWYRNQLWLLESGDGGIGTVDLNTGKYHAIAQLPGFTRGLAFLGPLAFIGLSQVRESAVFSGIPLVERAEERTCGVWVVHIDTGRTVAFVRFEDAVQEIFAVEALLGVRFPDLINHDPELIGTSYVLDDAALAEVPPELRAT